MADSLDYVNIFQNKYRSLNGSIKYHGIDQIFKITSKGVDSLINLKISSSKRDFEDLIDNFYFILFEGSGDGKRLPMKLDEKRIMWKIKKLRHHFNHDQGHGNPSEVRKKSKEIGEIYQELIGIKGPHTTEHWHYLSIEIYKEIIQFIEKIINNIPNLEDYYSESSNEDFKHFFEEDITIFPDKKVKHRTITKQGNFSHLAAAPVFIPHFSWTDAPHFGPINAAIHFSSKAHFASFDNYKKFLLRIKELWSKRIYFNSRGIRELFSWSISSDGKLVYGSGINNLLNAIKRVKIGIVTLFLIGTYGEDFSKTFFLISTNYWKGDRFRDNYLELYLSNMPLDFSWIEEINDSVKILSPSAEPATSYSLKSFAYHFWVHRQGSAKYDIRDKIIGGIGRDCFDDERDWDQFSGLILKNPFNENDFILDEELSSNIITRYIKCPVRELDEIVMSVTNSPPSVGDITSGKFIGFVNPKIHHLIFDGYGHTIHALLYWGWEISS